MFSLKRHPSEFKVRVQGMVHFEFSAVAWGSRQRLYRYIGSAVIDESFYNQL